MTTLQDQVERIEALLADRHVELPPPAVCAQLRRLGGMTQTDVGDAVGVTRMQVWRWEQGVSQPQGRNKALYAHLLRRLQEYAGEAPVCP